MCFGVVYLFPHSWVFPFLPSVSRKIARDVPYPQILDILSLSLSKAKFGYYIRSYIRILKRISIRSYIRSSIQGNAWSNPNRGVIWSFPIVLTGSSQLLFERLDLLLIILQTYNLFPNLNSCFADHHYYRGTPGSDISNFVKKGNISDHLSDRACSRARLLDQIERSRKIRTYRKVRRGFS